MDLGRTSRFEPLEFLAVARNGRTSAIRLFLWLNAVMDVQIVQRLGGVADKISLRSGTSGMGELPQRGDPMSRTVEQGRVVGMFALFIGSLLAADA